MRKKLKSLVLLCLFVSVGFGSTLTAKCQIDDPGCPPAAPGEPEQCPIDGGLAVLLIAGAAYGIKRHRNTSSTKQNSTAETK